MAARFRQSREAVLSTSGCHPRQFRLTTGNSRGRAYSLHGLRPYSRNRLRRNLCRQMNTSSHAEVLEQDADESIQNRPALWISPSVVLDRLERGSLNWW